MSVVRAFTVRQEGANVVILLDGRLVAELPWSHALNLGQGITYQARKAEEIAKHERVTADAALLLRAGSPINIVNDPGIADEAIKMAQYDRNLRRHLPGSPNLDSKMEVFAPSLLNSGKKG